MIFFQPQEKVDTQKGAALFITVLFFMSISTVVVAGSTSSLIRQYQDAQSNLVSTQAYYLAEAGGEDAFFRVKNSMTINTIEVLIEGSARATTSIIDISGGKRILSKASQQTRMRAVQTEVSSQVTTADFVYAAQVGEGGIYLDNNAMIYGTGGAAGDIMSNGPIEGGNGSEVTGSVIITTGDTGVQETFTTCNTDQNVGKKNDTLDVAQSFVAAQSGELNRIRTYIKKIGNASDANVHITADNFGEPATDTLASGVLDKDVVGADYAWVDIVFPTSATVASGTTYWLVFDGGSHTQHYYQWCGDSEAGYAKGGLLTSDDWSGGSWGSDSLDMTFKTVIGDLYSIIDNVDVVGTAKANTIKNNTVTGDAYYQVLENASVTGNSYAGSVDPSPIPMPIATTTVAEWKTLAESGGTINGNCPGEVECSTTMGPVKIDGDLTVDTEGATFTVDGVVHVTGNIDFNNNVTVRCNTLFADNSCIIIADGFINADNNVNLQGSGNSDSFLLLISTKDGCLGGTQQSDCASQNSAIYTANNVDGGILYATDSQVYINNGVDIDAVVAYRFELANTASVVYKTDVSDLSFLGSTGGESGGDWEFNDWQEVE